MKTTNVRSTIAALSVVALSACASGSKPVETAAAQPAKSTEPRVIVFESDANGFNTKTFFYDTGREVVAFDAQFTEDLAKKAIEKLRAETDSPIRYLVVTHPNPDKFNGMKAFQDVGAKVVMSEATADSMGGVNEYKKYFFVNMAKMFTEATYPKPTKADQVFKSTLTLELAGLKGPQKVELVELAARGVSSNQTVALVPELNKLVVGDLVHHKVHAWLEGPIVNGATKPDLRAWQRTLASLGKRFAKSNPEVLGGRGESAPLKDAVAAQIDYLKKADALVAAYVKKAPKLELKDAAKSQEHYGKLTKEFEAAFPGFGLSYMIQYGVYGSVNAKL